MKASNKYYISVFLFLLLSSAVNLFAQDIEIERGKYSGIKLFYDYDRNSIQLSDHISEDGKVEGSIIMNDEDYEKLVDWFESHNSFVTIYSNYKVDGNVYFLEKSGEKIIPVIASANLQEKTPVKVSLKKELDFKLEEMLIYDEIVR